VTSPPWQTHGLTTLATMLMRLTAPTDAQHDYVLGQIRRLKRWELQEIILRMFQQSSPLERSLLIELLQQETDTRFSDGRSRD
jgi:hypothetical protein